jgi:hypothetical protein
MPARNRSREAAKTGQDPVSNKSKKTKKRSGGRSSSRQPTSKPDPSAAEGAEIRYVMPADAAKTYLCPGCNREIPPGLGHLVAVPPGEPDLRRHWHRGCWNNRYSRF